MTAKTPEAPSKLEQVARALAVSRGYEWSRLHMHERTAQEGVSRWTLFRDARAAIEALKYDILMFGHGEEHMIAAAFRFNAILDSILSEGKTD